MLLHWGCVHLPLSPCVNSAGAQVRLASEAGQARLIGPAELSGAVEALQRGLAQGHAAAQQPQPQGLPIPQAGPSRDGASPVAGKRQAVAGNGAAQPPPQRQARALGRPQEARSPAAAGRHKQPPQQVGRGQAPNRPPRQGVAPGRVETADDNSVDVDM